MKAATLLAFLQGIGVVSSFSRPSVSNDNAYSEALFRTAKYRPEYPRSPFESLEAARHWATWFVDWYNTQHRHSAIKFVTPDQRHTGEDVEILARRTALYEDPVGRACGLVESGPADQTRDTGSVRPARKVGLAMLVLRVRRAWWRWLVVPGVGAALLVFSATAQAEENSQSAAPAPCPAECEPLPPVPEYGGCWKTRPLLSGDWGCRRTRLAGRGLSLRADWVQVAQGVIDGGLGERWAHTTNLDLFASFDLARMGISRGGVVSVRAQSRFGDTVNGDSGLLLPVHTYGYFPYTSTLDEVVPIALTEFNWFQMLSDKFGILLGKITTMSVANEFAGGEGRTQFMNFQFLFPSVFAQVAPYSTLAAGVVWAPSPRVSVTSLLLNLEDASTGTGFDDFDKGQTWWTNVDLNYRVGCMPGGVTLGAGYAFNADFASIGGLNIDPGAGTSLETRSETWAGFASAWQYLTTFEPVRDVDPANGQQDLRGLGAFAILGVGDESVNPVRWSVAAGLSGRGLIPGRCDDTCGIGCFYNRQGDPLSDSGLGRVLNGDSQGAEVYYRYAVAESIGVTLDAQWTGSGIRSVENAFLLGFRLHIDF